MDGLPRGGCEVREESYEEVLDEEGRHRIYVSKHYEHGLAGFVLVYFVIENGSNMEIATWDCAHGFAHRDLLYLPEDDKRRKLALSPAPLGEQFDEALDDVYRNWRRYYEEFCARRRNYYG